MAWVSEEYANLDAKREKKKIGVFKVGDFIVESDHLASEFVMNSFNSFVKI